jgi:hypothetical protein
MSKQADPLRHHVVVKVVEKYALRFFNLFLIVFSFLLFYFGPQIAPAYKEAFVSISTSLFASLVFALFYSAMVERHHQNTVNAELARSVKNAVQEMKQAQEESIQSIVDLARQKIEDLEKSHYHEISTHFRALIPARSFVSTNRPSREFNQLLNDALLQSHIYYFKGVTGRYIASRLSLARYQHLTCKVLLSDPSNTDLLRLYVKDRFDMHPSDRQIDARIEQVRQEIFMTIVDLFDLARWKIPVELKLYRGPVFYRTELLDEFFVISFFTSRMATPTAFPTTYLYQKESFYYETYLIDFNQAFELADISINLNARTTEPVLQTFLADLGCDLSLLPQLRQEAEQFRRAFLAQTDWQ